MQEDGTSPAHSGAMVAILSNKLEALEIKLELAATVTIGKEMVICTYSVEEDAISEGVQDIIFAAQRHIERVRVMFHSSTCFHNNNAIKDVCLEAAAFANSVEAGAKFLQAQEAATSAQQAVDRAQADLDNAKPATEPGALQRSNRIAISQPVDDAARQRLAEARQRDAQSPDANAVLAAAKVVLDESKKIWAKAVKVCKAEEDW